MDVKAFEEFIKESREEFKMSIQGYLRGSAELKNLLRRMLNQCGSQFEEETLKENLQEEFQLYLEGLKGA